MIAAARQLDGPAVERPSRSALGGPGRRKPTRSERRDDRDRAIVHCEDSGMTVVAIANAMGITPRAVLKAKARIRERHAAELRRIRAEDDSP